MDLTIGVDVGGTKIAAGVVDPRGAIVRRYRSSTPLTTAETLEAGIVEAVRTLREGLDVSAVGVAAAGFIDERRATVRFAANLPPWRNRPLRRIVGAAVGLPVVVENDANAAAWGEFRFGAGGDVDDMVLITVGTGLGGGIVLNGHLVRGAWGIAAELGHLRMVVGGHPCGCGNRGCWEQYTSGTALVRRARRLAGDRPREAARLLELAGGDPDAVTGRDVSRAAGEGDRAAVALLAEQGHWLGQGIADVAAVLDPARVVVGGGVSEVGDLLLDPARVAYARQLSGGAYRPHLQITAAALGNDAGVIGAADLARHP